MVNCYKENNHSINQYTPLEELMVKLELYFKVVFSISAKLNKENDKEKEGKCGQMDLIIMANGEKIKQMEKDNSKDQMVEHTRVIFKMIFSMVMVYTLRKIKSLLMKVDLTNICNMVMELKFVKDNTNIQEILKMILKTVMALLFMKMELFIKELGKMENLTGKELIKVPPLYIKEDGNSIVWMVLANVSGKTEDHMKETTLEEKKKDMEFIHILTENNIKETGYQETNMVTGR
jgi:hypothetical protein